MQLFPQALLLFALNFIDAILTVYWVRNGFASEGNGLMAKTARHRRFSFFGGKTYSRRDCRNRFLEMAQSAAGKIRSGSHFDNLYKFDGRSFFHWTFRVRIFVG